MLSPIFRILPSELQLEAAAVEDAIGGRIEIATMSRELARELGREDLVAITCGIDHRRAYATVHVPANGDLNARILGHEVMHAHRNLVEQVWQLEGRPGSRLPISIENDLEHLVIVPREMQMFGDAVAVWSNDFERNIHGLMAQSRQSGLSENDTFALRFEMLRAWLVTSLLVPTLDELKLLGTELDRRGWRRDATNIVAAYGRAGSSKQAGASMMVRFAGLDPASFGMMRFLPKLRTVERKALPAR